MNTIVWSDIECALEALPIPEAGSGLIVFGIGLLGVNSAPLLQKDGLPVRAFCDNDHKKWGTEAEGLPCIAPQELLHWENPFALVSTVKHYLAVHRQLEEMGIPNCTLDAYAVRSHLSDFQAVYAMLDEESRRIYAGVLLSRLTGNPAGFRALCSDHQYFALPEFRFPGIDEVFVDCGAFTGENSQQFINHCSGIFQKLYTFEGNPAAMAAMRRRLARERELWLFREDQIVCEQKFVGAVDGVKIPFHISEGNPANSFTGEAEGHTEWVESVTLDRYFSEQGEDRITFLKADIEGAEWDMLHGAEGLIRRSRPKMAVSVYHSIFDLYRIPLLLRQWVPEYRFAVRHHWNDFNETVLYCYV